MYRSRNEQLLDSSSIVIDDQQGSPVKPGLLLTTRWQLT